MPPNPDARTPAVACSTALHRTALLKTTEAGRHVFRDDAISGSDCLAEANPGLAGTDKALTDTSDAPRLFATAVCARSKESRTAGMVTTLIVTPGNFAKRSQFSFSFSAVVLQGSTSRCAEVNGLRHPQRANRGPKTELHPARLSTPWHRAQ